MVGFLYMSDYWFFLNSITFYSGYTVAIDFISPTTLCDAIGILNIYDDSAIGTTIIIIVEWPKRVTIGRIYFKPQRVRRSTPVQIDAQQRIKAADCIVMQVRLALDNRT